MCRLLAVKDVAPFAIADVVRPFAEIARRSSEFQGDGWGCAWWQSEGWTLHRSSRPIWEDDLTELGEARVLIAHARSAFRNEGIAVENNMPFLFGGHGFVFNGELHGVRLKEQGRIGAEKLFKFLLRFSRDGVPELTRGIAAVTRMTRHIRAMNFVLADGERFFAYSQFSENPDYFTVHTLRAGRRVVICSQPLSGEAGWSPLRRGVLEVL
jgi:predicted glutamine amidotransferase